MKVLLCCDWSEMIIDIHLLELKPLRHDDIGPQAFVPTIIKNLH